MSAAAKVAVADKNAPIQKRWFKRRLVWLGAGVLLFIIWLCVPTVYSVGNIHVVVHDSGQSGEVAFVVRDRLMQPLSGVRVRSCSFSGWTPESVTDASGVASIQPGESEVVAVKIQNQDIQFVRPDALMAMFGPSCQFGLTLEVTITMID